VPHRGLDGDEVDAGSGQQRAVCVPEVVKAQWTQAGRIPRALEAAAERRAVEAAPEPGSSPDATAATIA
jgi:hypothetical protein